MTRTSAKRGGGVYAYIRYAKDHVTVVTPVVNNPAFIRMQARALAKFMPVPYTFVVVNDAKGFPDWSNGGDTTLRGAIEATCVDLGIKCITTDDKRYARSLLPSRRHAEVMNFIFRTMALARPGRYLFLDSDMVPVGPLKFSEWDAASSGAFLLQQRSFDKTRVVKYVWPNVLYVNTARTVGSHDALDFRVEPGLDSGGASRHWLAAQPPDSVHWMTMVSSLGWASLESKAPDVAARYPALSDVLRTDPRNGPDGAFFCELVEGCILHLRAGSGWRRDSGALYSALVASLDKVLEKATSD